MKLEEPTSIMDWDFNVRIGAILQALAANMASMSHIEEENGEPPFLQDGF